MRSWNAHQQSAIDARGKSIVVSAAAGSGKTSVLTERVLRLVEEGEDIERMLIVTFTNLAASEMRERIYKRLQEASLQSPRLAAQAEKCTFADISTLHKFCGRLIRDNFEQAGTSPAFAIADDAQTGRLKQAALDHAIEQAMADEKLLPRIRKFAHRGDTENIRRIVHAIYNRAVSLKDPKGWLKAARAHFDGGAFIGVLFDEIGRMARDAAMAAQPYLQARTALWDERGFSAEAKMCACECAAFLRSVKSLQMGSVALPEASHIVVKQKGAPNRESSSLTNRANKQFETLREYQGDFAAKVNAELSKTADDGRFFIDLTLMFMARYAMLKRAKNLLDHDDTMHFAIKALRSEEVAARCRSRYAHVFVDEYQDINEAQHAIIERLMRGGNDFLVGDVKQCIYTFRESNPDLLIRRCDELMGNGLIEMNTNYRSTPPVIDFINGVMRHMMSADAGGVNYEGGQVLCAGAEGSGCVEIVLAGREEDGDNLSAETAQIVRQVKKLTAKGYDYGDIAVLRPEMRSSGRQIAAALARAGIPAVNGFGAADADFAELTVFKNLLMLIGGRGDDTVLLSVMRYPYFGFTEPDFAQIRLLQQPGGEDKSFSHAVRTFAQVGALGDKVRGFLAQIERYARLCACMKLPDFLHSLRQEVQLRAYALTSPGGVGCDAAISTFIDAVAAQKPASLADVLDVADRLGTTREAQQSPSGSGSVYLTTIHKSKGLEFRAVLLCGLHKVIDQRDVKGEVLVGRGLGLALDVMDEQTHIKCPTLHKLAVARGLKREKISETVRLLYVGMTRAIEHLVLLGAGAEIREAWCENKPEGWQHSAYKHFDLLMPAIHMACQDRGLSLEDVVQLTEPESAEEEPQDKAQRLAAFFCQAEKVTPAELFEGYAYEQDMGVPSKVSVSALKRRSEKTLLRPTFVPSDTEGVTAAQRGTLTHRVLERIGLGLKTSEQVREFVTQMEKQGIIETGMKAHVDAQTISAFLDSEIASRARQSPKCLLEQPFCLQMSADECGIKQGSDEPVIIQGVIDLCFLEDEQWVVVDYKTDAITPAGARAAAEKFALQLELYAQALSRITGLGVKQKYVYFLSADTAICLD